MKSFNRRQFVASISASTAALAMPAFIFASRPEEYIEAETIQGRIKFARKNGVNNIKGIHYGGTVSGGRRFKRPAPLEPGTGVRDTLQMGAPAACCLHRLAVNFAQYIACGKQSCDICFGATGYGLHIARFVHVDSSFINIAVWPVADGNKKCTYYFIKPA